MKNITKKLISVLTLVVIFSMIGANISLAAFSKKASFGTSSSHSISPASKGNGISSGSGNVGQIKNLLAPTVSGLTVTNINQTSAELHGIVNPNGSNTIVTFLAPNSVTFGTTNIGSGTGNVSVPFTINSLTPNTTYQVKMVAGNINGYADFPTNGSFISFTTSASPNGAPTYVNSSVGGIDQTSAKFKATINPNGIDTLVSFLLNGSSTVYCPVNIANGINNVAVPTCTVSGLTPNTNYTFHVVASNSLGQITDGQFISFTTLPLGSQCTTPTISSISPNNVNAGSGTTNVIVTGSNFNSNSSAQISGQARTTNYSSSTSLTMVLTSSDVASSGTKSITVTNGSGCDSNAVTFTINAVGGNGGGGGGGGGGSYHYATVVTQNATNITANSTILNGTIDPNGSNTTAWFEYGTSSNLSSVSETVHVNQGSGTNASALAQSISGLAPSTTYYFRAVANNTYGTVKGNIYSFTTAIRNGTVTTVQATSKSSTSAKLNGIFINPNRTQATGYFEYGKTASLSNKTTEKDLGTSTSVSFSNFVTGLTPNTIYFFRAVVKNQGVINNGNILVFKTSVAGIDLPPTEIVTVEPIVVETESSILKITNEKDEIAIGDEVNYLVSFKNTDSKNFENAKLSVQLPKEVDFIESNFGKLNSDNDLVEFNPGILLAGQIGSITIKAKVNSKAQDNNLLITTAVMSYNIEGSTETKDEIAYATNHIIAGVGLEANPLFGANFLPSTLLGWLALLLVILGLAIVGKNLYSNYAIKGNGRKTSGDIDNLPM